MKFSTYENFNPSENTGKGGDLSRKQQQQQHTINRDYLVKFTFRMRTH